MRPCHTTVTRDDVHRHVLHRLTTHLRLPDLRGRTPAAVVLQVVLAAAARLCSIFAAARRLATAPSDQTIRTALANGLPERWELVPSNSIVPLTARAKTLDELRALALSADQLAPRSVERYSPPPAVPANRVEPSAARDTSG